MDKNKYLLLEIANLEVDSKIGKDRHFIAADRKNKRRIILGLFSVVGTAIIASKATSEIFYRINLVAYEQVFISVISLLVGVSTAVLGFLGLEKQVTQHRLVGNMYIDISRRARRLINMLHEADDLIKVKTEFDTILTSYLSVNKEGESCPTSGRDNLKSLALNSSSRAKIKAEIKRQDDSALQLKAVERVLSLRQMVVVRVKTRLALFLHCIGLISESDKDKYIKQCENKL